MDRTKSIALLVASGAFAAAAMVCFWSGGVDGKPRSSDSDPCRPASAPRAVRADLVSGATSASSVRPPDRSHLLELPDGSRVPALNGAVDAEPLVTYWGPFPYSPIVGIERSDGVDWYRHEDGSFSTTQMVWRRDLGRYTAMTRVAHPGPTPPAASR